MIISIIVPCYNAEKYLTTMIESVLQQTYSELELIIVNDGSTDSSLDIMKDYATHDPRIKIIDGTNKGKPSMVRNVGIRKATGDIITFLDADDVYTPNRLEFIVEGFNQYPECSIVVHDFNRVSEDGKVFSKGLIESKWTKHNMSTLFDQFGDFYYASTDLYLAFLNDWFFVHTNSIAIRRKDYQLTELLFDESLVYFEDLNKWSELVVSRKVVYIDKTLSSYRETPGSLMSDTTKFDIAGIVFFQKHLYSPLIELPEETKNIVHERLVREIKDASYELATAGNIAKTYQFTSMLFKLQPSINNSVLLLKHTVLSVFKRITK